MASKLAMAALLATFTMCGVGAANSASMGCTGGEVAVVYLVAAPIIGMAVGRVVLSEAIRFYAAVLVPLAYLGLIAGAMISPERNPWIPRLYDWAPMAAAVFLAVLLGTFLLRRPRKADVPGARVLVRPLANKSTEPVVTVLVGGILLLLLALLLLATLRNVRIL